MPLTREDRIAALRELEVRPFESYDLKDLERRWLDATCLYEQLDDAVLSDGRWDELTIFLWRQRLSLSPYFREAVPYACLASSTGSGVCWDRGIPALVLGALSQ